MLSLSSFGNRLEPSLSPLSECFYRLLKYVFIAYSNALVVLTSGILKHLLLCIDYSLWPLKEKKTLRLFHVESKIVEIKFNTSDYL